MKTNQPKPSAYSLADYKRSLLSVGVPTPKGFNIRFKLQVGLIALSALVLFGCSQPRSQASYSHSSTDSMPTSSGADSYSQPPSQASYSAPSGGPTPTPSTGAGTVALPPAGDSDLRVNAFIRPSLLVRQGQYYAWAMPIDWQSYETANGVDLTSPDGRLIVNSGLLVGNPGQTTPWNFVVNVLTQIGARDIYGISTKNLPSLPSAYPGVYWQFQEFELTCTDTAGIYRQADWICGICNAYGGYSVIFQSFSAPVNEYDRAKTWLPLLPQSVVVTNPGQIAYHDQLIPVQNHPLDNSGLMESWQQKRLSQDRIAKAQQEGMMGYERMVSPSTGEHYNMPLEAYDGTVGGYRNPKHPDEILQPTKPGE